MTYRCTTEGCSLGDCPNCVAVAELYDDSRRWRFVRDRILVLRSEGLGRVQLRGWAQYGFPEASAPASVTDAVDMARMGRDEVARGY